MRRFVLTAGLSAGVLMASGAFAAGFANHYECIGDDTAATVYFGPGGAAPAFKVVNLGLGGPDTTEVKLDRVTSEFSPMGRLVTGVFTNIADARLTFTMIIPTVGIEDEDVRDVKAMLVRTLEGTMPPPSGGMGSGPRQSNEFRPVTCVASIVR
jgi:hypothetical protein